MSTSKALVSGSVGTKSGTVCKTTHVQLEPSRKKLTTLETQRVMGVWDDSLKRVEILTAVPYILDNINDFSIVLGRELLEELQRHQEYKVLKNSYIFAL